MEQHFSACRYTEALQISEEAIASLKVSVGPDNPNVATAIATKVVRNRPPSTCTVILCHNRLQT